MILLCLLLVACGRGGEQTAEEPADTSTVVPPPPPLSNNQALDVLMALSAAGVEAAAGGPGQIATPDVRRYLGVVRADHTALQAELKAIADSLQLSPEPHEAGDRVRTAARDARSAIDQQGYGTADAVALEQQVRLHSLFLAMLDSAVLRGSRQQLLAQYATAVRPMVSAHLQRAEQLERLLQSQPPTAPPTGASGTPTAAAIDTPPRPRPASIDTGRRPRPDTVPQR
jgi:predicted outer membrane protein